MTLKKFFSLSMTLTMGNIGASKAAFTKEENPRSLGFLFSCYFKRFSQVYGFFIYFCFVSNILFIFALFCSNAF